LKTGTIAACFHKLGIILRLKKNLENRHKNFRAAHCIKRRYNVNSNRFIWPRLLCAIMNIQV
jgi:hypothetical protein